MTAKKVAPPADITEALEEGAPLLLNTWDAARLLNVSDNHIRVMIGRGEVQARRLGRRLLVPRSEVARIVAGR